ncbi:MAG: helix-turn-helix domain-containing protein [Chloroflexota bacterium]|nr:helix-turn-helix domain-containing protein [Chloroflexota bacterium]
MILNERQYRITKAAGERIAKRVQALTSVPTKDLSPRQHAFLLKAGRGQLEDLRQEVEEYEALRKGAIPIAPIGGIEELPLALIRARIARGWTQAELAEELGVAEQQVQRDEANVYRGASIERLCRVGDALGVRLRGALEPTYARRDGRASRSMIREEIRRRITLKSPRK